MSAAPPSENATFPVLSGDQVLAALRAKRAQLPFYAMFSSYLGGITTDPALMTIPLDDHMCHRGHAVFDTAAVEHGYLYRADPHIERFLKSAATAKINHKFTAEYIKNAIKSVVIAGGHATCSVRMWITAGPGDFSYSPAGCTEACLYVICFKWFPMPPIENALKEWTVPTCMVGLRATPIGTMKSSNYLANVLMHLEAKQRGGYFGLWVQLPDGMAALDTPSSPSPRDAIVKEGPINAIIVVKRDGSVVTPPAVDILQSVTARRVLEILSQDGTSRPSVGYGVVTVGDVQDAQEAFFVGGSTHVMPIGSLDGVPINDGKTGPIARLVLHTIESEARAGTMYAEKIMDA